MSISYLSGYTGIFKQPIAEPNRFGPTIYGMSDINKKELFLVLLTPETFYDAYRILKGVAVMNVTIFVPSVDTLFISDLINLVLNIHTIKPSTRWVFPTDPTLECPSIFKNLQIKKTFFQHRFDSDISIEYINSGNLANPCYDIITRDGGKTKYFCQYLNAEKLELLFNNPEINEIHLTNNVPLYGGLSYVSALEVNPKYRNKLYAHSFSSESEYNIAQLNKVNIGPFIFNALNVSGIPTRDYLDINDNPDAGLNGKSAYELAVENGFIGTINEWLESLKGTNGKNAYQLAVELGFNGSLEDWIRYIENNTKLIQEKLETSGNITLTNNIKTVIIANGDVNLILPSPATIIAGGVTMNIESKIEVDIENTESIVLDLGNIIPTTIYPNSSLNLEAGIHNIQYKYCTIPSKKGWVVDNIKSY